MTSLTMRLCQKILTESPSLRKIDSFLGSPLMETSTGLDCFMAGKASLCTVQYTFMWFLAFILRVDVEVKDPPSLCTLLVTSLTILSPVSAFHHWISPAGLPPEDTHSSS